MSWEGGLPAREGGIVPVVCAGRASALPSVRRYPETRVPERARLHLGFPVQAGRERRLARASGTPELGGGRVIGGPPTHDGAARWMGSSVESACGREGREVADETRPTALNFRFLTKYAKNNPLYILNIFSSGEDDWQVAAQRYRPRRAWQDRVVSSKVRRGENHACRGEAVEVRFHVARAGVRPGAGADRRVRLGGSRTGARARGGDAPRDRGGTGGRPDLHLPPAGSVFRPSIRNSIRRSRGSMSSAISSRGC